MSLHLQTDFPGGNACAVDVREAADSDIIYFAADPRGGTELDPISVVCKVRYVTDHVTGKTASAVKLSDNYEKATGDADAVDFYRETFGAEGVKNAPVIV